MVPTRAELPIVDIGVIVCRSRVGARLGRTVGYGPSRDLSIYAAPGYHLSAYRF